MSCSHASDYSSTITNIMSAWLCIISQPGGYAIRLRSSPPGIFQYTPLKAPQMMNFSSRKKGVVLSSGVSGHPKNMRKRSSSLMMTSWLFSQHHAPPCMLSAHLTKWSVSPHPDSVKNFFEHGSFFFSNSMKPDSFQVFVYTQDRICCFKYELLFYISVVFVTYQVI